MRSLANVAEKPGFCCRRLPKRATLRTKLTLNPHPLKNQVPKGRGTQKPSNRSILCPTRPWSSWSHYAK